MIARDDLKFGVPVTLKWHDSKGLEGWQYDPSKERRIGTIQTIGRVVNTSPLGISITTSIADGEVTFSDLTIPWIAITELEILPEEYIL